MPDENVSVDSGSTAATATGESTPQTGWTQDPVTRTYDDIINSIDEYVERAAAPAPEVKTETPAPAEPTTPEVAPEPEKPAEAPAPTVEPVVEEPPAAHSRFAPFFQQYQDDNTAVSGFMKALDEIAAYDPQVDERLMNAAFWRHENTYKHWVLNSVGISASDIDQYKAWKDAGAQMPQPQFQAPPFPVPDTLGIVTMPNGVQLDVSETGDPRDRMLYDVEKREYERGISQQKADFEKQQADQRTAAEQARVAREEQEQKYYETIQQREQEFTQGLIDVMNNALTALNIQYDESAKFLENALRLDIQNAVFQNPKVIELANQATPLVHQGGQRAKDFAFEIGKIIRATVKEKVEAYNAFVVGRSRALTVAAVGKPNLEAVKPIVAGTPAPQQPERKGPRTMADIERDFTDSVASQFRD